MVRSVTCCLVVNELLEGEEKTERKRSQACSLENPNNYSNNEDVVGDDFKEEGAALAMVGASTSGFSQSSLDHTEYGFDLPSLAVTRRP